jgi:hypothetical protein
VSGAGVNLSPAVGVDPASDHAVAAWLAGGAHGAVQYASAAGAPGYRPHRASALLPRVHGGGTHWLRITLAALAGVGLVAAAALAALRRRRVVSR